MYKDYFKPILDFIIALLLFILISPIFIIITVFLSIANSGKPFFIQKRPGKKGQIFSIVKFKTMNDKKNLAGELLPDDQRLTTVGKLVRKTSLDEIPQLINVIKGDMSLIGPRPLLPQYLSLYNDFQRRRNEMRPGITGWAQVNGRNSISWEKKFEHDVYYVDHCSFLMDLKIIFLTIKKVFKSEGIAEEGHVTSNEFKGNLQ